PPRKRPRPHERRRRDHAAAGATSFHFPTAVESGGPFAVSVTAQPHDPAQMCTVADGAGTVVAGDVVSVLVDCATSASSVGAPLLGLHGSGLVLTNGADVFAVPPGVSAFRFPTPVASGASYAAAIAMQPTAPRQACTLTAGSGTVGAGDVTNLVV